MHRRGWSGRCRAWQNHCVLPPVETFQAIRAPGMLVRSAQLAGSPAGLGTLFDLVGFMTDADIENVVFVYLQILGWYVIPGTWTPTAWHYKFVLVNRWTGLNRWTGRPRCRPGKIRQDLDRRVAIRWRGNGVPLRRMGKLRLREARQRCHHLSA
jgi:hypothetical protein